MFQQKIRCTDTSAMYNSSYAERVRYFKEDKKGVKRMSRFAEELMEEGKFRQVKASVSNLVADGITDLEKLARYAGTDIETVKKALEALEIKI